VGTSSAQQGIMQPRFPLRSTLDNKPFNIIQSLPPITLTSSSVAPVFSAQNFTFNQFDQVTQLAAVFDQYRFVMIECEFIPGVNDNNVAATNMGLFATVIDYDDATVLSSFNTALDYTNCLVGSGYEAQRRTFIPHTAVAAYAGAFTSFSNVTSPWIDSGSPSVQHYGLKTAWTATTTTAQIMTLLPKVWVQFRNVR